MEARLFVPATIRLSTGTAGLPGRPAIRTTLSAHELHMLARAIDREADEARAADNDDLATRLDWRAADLREAAR
jgi:hypothetical protein